MMSAHKRFFPRPRDARAEALAWRERLERFSEDEDIRAAFDAWLEEDEKHGEAYARVERVWKAAAEPALQPGIAAMREEALRAAPRRRMVPVLWGVAGAAVIIGAVTPFALRLISDNPATSIAATLEATTKDRIFQTAVGERSLTTLADGSSVTLNTNSRIDVHYSQTGRRITLDYGQAYFEIARDPDRPFIVTAGRRQVIALGTAFEIRLDADDVKVTLIEGSAAVTMAKDAPVHPSSDLEDRRNVRLEPGQQFVAVANTAPTVQDVDATDVLSWRDGRVTFRDEPLIRAVAEMNRYTSEKLILSPAAPQHYRITGVFRTGSTASFVAAIESAYPITAQPGADGVVLLAPREE